MSAWLLASPGRAIGDEPGTARPLPPAETRAWQTGLLRPDRIEHASLAWTLGLALGAVTREPAVPLVAGITLGTAKEAADRRSSGFDLVDLGAGCIGAAAAAALTTLWRR